MSRRNRPVVAFPKHRFAGAGTRVVTEDDLEYRKCPACKGTKKLILADLPPLTLHTERDWRCKLCDGVGVILTSEATFKDLTEYYR